MTESGFGDILAPAGAGFWRWDRASGAVEWDSGIERLFGLEPGTFEGTFEGWTRRIHPDDLSSVVEKLDKAVETGGPVLFDHRCVWPDGSVHWLECRGGLLFDSQGEVTGAVGLSIDIDYRRLSEEERRTLLESERAARRSLESAWERLAQLHVVAVRLAAAASVREVGQVLVSQGATALRADGGFFSVVDHDRGILSLQASQGAAPEVVEYYETVSLHSNTAAAVAAREGEPIYITSPEDRRRRFPDMPDQGADAFVIYPVSVEGSTRAVLAFGYSRSHEFAYDEEELIETIVGMSSQAIQRASLHDATRSAATRSIQLENVIAQLAGATTRQHVADIVVDSLLPAVGAQKGSLYLVDDDSRTVRALAIHGYSRETTEAAVVLPLDSPNAPSDAIRTKAPVYIEGENDFALRYPQLARTFGVSEVAQRAVAFPMLVEGEAIGTIGLGFEEGRPLTEEERRHLAIVAGICAQALGRAKAFEEAQAATARLRSIDQITDAALSRLSLDDLIRELPARIAAALGCDAVRLSLIDEAGEYLEVQGHYGIPEERLARVPVGRGLSGTIAKLGQPQVIEDISKHEVVGPPFPDHVTSEAGVPLRSGGGVIGVLDIGAGPQRPLTNQDVDILTIAADRVATAIERSRAYEIERAERARSDLIGRLAEVVSQVGPLGGQMEQISELLSEGMAECCVLTVVSEFERPMVACGHRDPEKKELTRSAAATVTDDMPEGDTPAVADERSRLYSAPDRAALEAIEDEQVRRLMERLDLHSALTVPLRGVHRSVGRAVLGRTRNDSQFGPDDAGIMEDLGARIGSAIEGRMTFERHRRTAVTLQQSLLPAELPRIDGFEIAARYWPASESFEVGGDFYDVIELGDDRWGIMVGDVSGKGVEAAAMTGIARHTARAAARHGIDSRGVLRWVHEAFMEQAESSETYCTAVFGLMERESGGFRFRFAVGGHPLPIHRTNDGNVRFAGEPGTVLGLIEPVELTESEVWLGADDWLVIYTDGVTDVPVADAITESELLEIVREATRGSAHEAMTALDVVLKNRYGHYRNRDDTAVLILRCRKPDRSI